jgi:hypothetical protein
MVEIGEPVFCKFASCDQVRSFGPGVDDVEMSLAMAKFPKNNDAATSVPTAMRLNFMITLFRIIRFDCLD